MQIKQVIIPCHLCVAIFAYTIATLSLEGKEKHSRDRQTVHDYHISPGFPFTFLKLLWILLEDLTGDCIVKLGVFEDMQGSDLIILDPPVHLTDTYRKSTIEANNDLALSGTTVLVAFANSYIQETLFN